MPDNKTTVIITGKTTKQMVDEMRLIEYAEASGVKPPEVKTCYMCKREEGEDAVRINEDGASFQLPPIELELYEIVMTEGINFGYWLCNECVLLLCDFAARPLAE
ncbi:MAG: hypothetical protein JSV77_00825 [Dehalococcoidales bacterium]|nr:MAG: hypothetical protein JSV77_00825 [Dehalococcoidales bacterium]